tara:strand:- start:102 stop:617 length:516 start_codon:yes stop_codon:yes gene_type:complete
MELDYRQERLEKAAAFYGKLIMKKEIAKAYQDVWNNWNDTLFDRVFNFVEEGEMDRFPEPYQLKKLGIKLKQGIIKNYFNDRQEKCYYCDDTGFVPELIQPEIYNGRWIINNMICKCSKGKLYMGSGGVDVIRGYFDKYSVLQFEPQDDIDYAMIVYEKCIELNKKGDKNA